MVPIFLITFVSLVGFGLLIPLLPFIVERTGVGAEIITIVLGLYSLAQLVAAPIWGRISDKWGRKPVLVLTSYGLAASYIIVAYAESLEMLIISRIVGGVMAANIGAAQAYMADITTPATRAKGMGLLGAAFGLGFIFGPAIGGVLGGNDAATADFFWPSMVSAAITIVAALGAQFGLKESLSPEIRAKLAAAPKIRFADKIRAGFGRRTLMMLMICGFLAITAWAQFETIFALWADAKLDYGPRDIGLMLTFIGVVGVVVQGGAIGPLTKKFGERNLCVTALALLCLGYVGLSFAFDLVTTLLACAVLSAGSGLFNPSISSLVSHEAAETERGAVMGAYQSATALSRIVGPAFSGVVFAALGSTAPYLVAAGLVVPALVMVLALPKAGAKV
ncbi:MAG: MFS transporter [Rhodospirillaceae bacterium]|nr:MFS transporter [Rhodospirillaceae bacterium]